LRFCALPTIEMAQPKTNFNLPVPNNPFYSPLTTYVVGPYHTWEPIDISGYNFTNGTFFGGGGGGGGGGSVTSVSTAGGLLGGPITTIGTISIANTGVVAGTYSNPVITVNPRGQLTFASAGTPPLLLSGGTMTGLINFAPAQTFPNTIRSISGISPISAVTTSGNTVVSVNSASTTGAGVVQLVDTTTSTSTTQALTAAQGKFLQDQINSLLVSGGLTLAGSLNVSSGTLTNVTSAGSAAGFTTGAALPSASIPNTDFFVVCDSAGTYTPPGGTPYLVNKGDWFYSDGVNWQYFPAGSTSSYASTTAPGVVELATDTETITGADATRAVTPASLQAKVASETLLGITRYATAAEAAAKTLNVVALTPLSLASILASTSSTGLVQLATNLESITGTDALKAITPATLSARVATNAVTGLVRLATAIETIAGTDNTTAITPFSLSSRVATQTGTGLIRIATSAEVASGLDNTTAITPLTLGSRVATETVVGMVELATNAETIAGTDTTRAITPANLSARVATLTGTGIVQLTDSITSTSVTTAATANSVKMAIDACIPKVTLTGKGSIVSASAAGTPLDLPVGPMGAVLNVDLTTATGLAWTTIVDGGTF
jgi:hypothetical protein